MIGDHPTRLFVNPRQGVPGVVVLTESGFRRAVAEITAWPGYSPTPLRQLPPQGFASLHYKDEAGRFGLGSFKALGGAYAVQKLVVGELARAGIRATGAEVFAGRHAPGVTVTCATDGNHGRSVAWGARNCRAACVIFVHPGVTQGRRDAIAAYGAETREVPGNYDDSVRAATAAAQTHGWHVISDTSWPGYTEPPRDVMQGYRLMAEEALAAMATPAHPCLHPGRRRRRGGCGRGAAARAPHPGEADRGRTRSSRLSTIERRARHAQRRLWRPAHPHGRPGLRRAQPARLAGA